MKAASRPVRLEEATMRYLCLVNLDRDLIAAMSDEEGKRLDRDSLAHDDALRAAGNYITSSALGPVQNAVTLRIRDGARLATDGPFVETKEFVAGFLIIEARDRDHALDIAAGIPCGRLGSIEVRELVDIGTR
jgi:hypothetical protein